MQTVDAPTTSRAEVPSLVPASGRLGDALRWLLAGLCLEIVFAVPYRSLYLLTGSVPLSWVAGLAFVLVALGGYTARARIEGWASTRMEAWAPGRRWFAGWWVAGLLLRLGWAALLRVQPGGDGLTYWQEATILTTQHRYDGVFFPPGLPLFEAPLLMLFGVHTWVATLYTLITFSLIFYLVRQLGTRIGHRRVAGLACALVAIWPNNIACAGTNDKEELLAVLITGAFLLFLRSREAHGWSRVALLFVAGLLTGGATLAQPAFLMFPAVIFGNEVFWSPRTAGGLVRGLDRSLVFALGLLLAVAPWTYRNYRVYHRMVLVTVNGGSVFFRANNPKANAQYVPEPPKELRKDPFTASEEGYREGKRWIRENPAAFAMLAIRKQVVFLGDDTTGIYESLKRDRQPSAILYAGLKMLANLFWVAIFGFVFVASSWMFRTGRWRIWYGICVLPLMYQWFIDSIFEAGSHHHNAYFGLVAILLAIAFVSAGGRQSQTPSPS